MELRLLQSFVVAAECRSFTRAADTLEVTQAAISQHVAALEKELDAQLFTRQTRTVALTEAGRCLYDYARKILDLSDAARREVGRASTAVGGTLRIAASTVPSQWLLPALLARFRQACPQVRQSVIVADSVDATRAVELGHADLGIVGEMPHGSRLAARPIADDELILVVAADHPLARRRKITLAELARQPLIVRESGSGSRHCVERALEAAGISPGDLDIALEMNSNEAIRAAVQAGLGAAFLSHATVKNEIDGGRLASVGVQSFRAQRHLFLITDPQRIPTAASRAFLTLAEQWSAENKPRRKRDGGQRS